MKRIVTAREQYEMLSPWLVTADTDWRRQRRDQEWAQKSLTPKQQRKQYEKSIKNDPAEKADWASRPKKGDPTLETGPEYLPQPTLPGMEKIKGEGTRLWRGVPVDTSDPAFRKVWQMTYGQGEPVDDPGMFPDADLRYQDRGGEFDHPGLADAIVDGFNAKGGVGEHHSTDFDVADSYGRGIGEGSYNPGAGPHLPVLMDSDWNGKGESYSRAGSGNVDHEHEIMLKHKQAPLTVRDLRVPSNATEAEDFGDYRNDWNPILNDSRETTAARSWYLTADAKIGNGQKWDDKFWRGKSKDRFARRLWREAALSPEDWVSVAEQSMERAGHGGHQFNIPTATFDKARERGYSDKYGQPDARRLQREYSQESEDYVNNILAEQGWDLAQKGHRVRVEPEHWDLRNGGQAVTDGCNYIGIKGNDTNSLALLHETAHILSKTPHTPGGHGPDFQKIVHGLYHNYLNPEAADIFSGIVSPSGRTSAKPRRFNQDWQVIGGDYFPLDVISHYMDRKGEGFGDEKAPLYEMNGKPPLSQQITEDGYEKPVELCTDGRSGRVYDGHHRIDVARQLGHTHVPVQVSWRNSSGYGNEGAYGNKIEPWLKGWLTDMRRGRETVGARRFCSLEILKDASRRFWAWAGDGPVGIEEYPSLSRKEQKALYDEIISQGGPPLLSNVYHPENWGSGDPRAYHHYVARGREGTIHGVLAAWRSYGKMEPKRPGGGRYIHVHDVYTGADAPKGTGTTLMQAVAHRAMRDGADFAVSGVVPHASGFYHSLGGTREPNCNTFEWAPEDRDALAMGAPNRRPVTPMSCRWVGNPNPPFGNDMVDPVMPPGADDPVGFGEKFVPSELRKRITDKTSRRFWAIRADMSDQPDDVTDDYTLAEFFQWCAHNRYKPNQVALDQYAQVSGMDLQDYQDLSNFLDGMELGGDGFLDKTSRYLRNPGT